MNHKDAHSLPALVTEQIKVTASDCWEWTGTKDRAGYGQVRIGSTHQGSAHRVVWVAMVGPVSADMELDHRCHNRACVNPDHIREVTHKQNLENRRGAQRNNPTGHRGVHRRSNGRFSARAKHNGRDYSAGTFGTVEEAAEAAGALRLRLFTNTQELPAAPAPATRHGGESS